MITLSRKQIYICLIKYENKSIVSLGNKSGQHESRFKYLKDNWFGLGYRSDGTTSLSFGVKANNLHIGYSYDYQLSSNIMSSTYGTHEITLSFYIPAFQHNRHTNYWIF